MNKYLILYNQTTISETNSYNDALNIATRYGNGAHEDIIIIDNETAEILTKLSIRE